MPEVNLKLSTVNDVLGYEDPRSLIDSVLDEGIVAVLGGYTGVGKSIVALSMSGSAMTGEPLFGKYQVVKTGPVLFVDEETPKGYLKQRIQKMGFSQDLPFYLLHFQEIKLDRDDCFDALMKKIEEIKPVLVVIDSLIRVHSQREDDAMSMSLVISRLRKIANGGTTVLVIHHHKKGEGPLSQKLRGSSDIPGGVDIEFALFRKNDSLVFTTVKTRTKPIAPIELKMVATGDKIEIVYEGDGIEEKEAVLTQVVRILRKTEKLRVTEISQILKEKGVGVGVNALRDILTGAAGKELIEEVGPHGKKLYSVNPASQVNDSLDSGEAVKLEEAEPTGMGVDSPEENDEEEDPNGSSGSELRFTLPYSRQGNA